MLTQAYFYTFDTKSKPGKILARGIRFETVELVADQTFDATKFKILCDHHAELKPFSLGAFRHAVLKNFA